MTLFSVSVVGDSEIIAKLREMPDKVKQSLYNKCLSLALYLEGYVKSNKLQGQVLNHITGRLQQSIHSDADIGDMSATGRVFSASPMPYAAIHEFGGTIPAHIVEVKNALALHFTMAGKDVFATRVQIPAIQMPERSFLRSSLADNKDKIIAELTEAVTEGIAK